jgi:hypothetical protein
MHISRVGLLRDSYVIASVNTIVVTYNVSHHVVVAAKDFYDVNSTLFGNSKRDRRCMYNVTMRRFSGNNCCAGTAIGI